MEENKTWKVGDKVYVDSETELVEIKNIKPCKSSVLSKENDAKEYLIENENEERYWVFQDSIMDPNEEYGQPIA